MEWIVELQAMEQVIIRCKSRGMERDIAFDLMIMLDAPTTVGDTTVRYCKSLNAELAQSVERTTLNRVVVGSIPTFGAFFF